MSEWRHIDDSFGPPPHYPPVDMCAALKSDAKGNIIVLEKFDTPTDENGIPNPYESLRLLASMFDMSYVLPGQTNIHHQVHYRSEYQDTLGRAYRDSPSLMMHMPVQMHNLDHKLLIRAPKPSVATMEQYVREQQLISYLFKLGSAAVANARSAVAMELQIEYMSNADQRMTIVRIEDRKRRARMKRKLYEKELGRHSAGRLGLMPDPDTLDAMGIADATTYLGKIGGNSFLDFRRASQDFIKRYGIDQSVASPLIRTEAETDLAA